MSPRTAAAVPPTLEGFPGAIVPVALIDPHPDNPRRSFDDAAMSELTASVKEKGIIEPLIGRWQGDRVQLICGERRWRAAVAAGVGTVPMMFRDDLNEEAILEFMLIENIQRAGVEELEEAESFEKLLSMHSQYDTTTLALKVSRSVRHVQARLELLRLVPEAKEALRAHKITAGHGQLICRLKPEDQPRAVQACFVEVDLVALPEQQQSLIEDARYADEDAPRKGKKKGPAPEDVIPHRLRSVRELDDWIKTHVKADREQLAQQLPELQDAIMDAEAEGRKVLEISFLTRNEVNQAAYRYDGRTLGSGDSGSQREETIKALRRVVFAPNWKRADGTKKTTPGDYGEKPTDSPACEHSVLGIVTFGYDVGQQFKVCVAKKKCKVHWAAEQRQSSRSRPANAGGDESDEARKARWARESAESERKRKVWRAMLPAVRAAILKKATPAFMKSYFERAVRSEDWHDNMTRSFVTPLKVDVAAIEKATLAANPGLAPPAEKKKAALDQAHTSAAKKLAEIKKRKKPAKKTRAAKKGRK